jgi:hypothetical protein
MEIQSKTYPAILFSGIPVTEFLLKENATLYKVKNFNTKNFLKIPKIFLEFIFEISVSVNLSNETIQSAILIVQNYIKNDKIKSQENNLQLICIAAIWLSSKVKFL